MSVNGVENLQDNFLNKIDAIKSQLARSHNMQTCKNIKEFLREYPPAAATLALEIMKQLNYSKRDNAQIQMINQINQQLNERFGISMHYSHLKKEQFIFSSRDAESINVRLAEVTIMVNDFSKAKKARDSHTPEAAFDSSECILHQHKIRFRELDVKPEPEEIATKAVWICCFANAIG